VLNELAQTAGEGRGKILSEPRSSELIPGDRGKAEDLLKKLKPLLQTYNTGSFNLLDDILQTLGPEEECRQLVDKIRDFDFAGALGSLESIEKKFKKESQKWMRQENFQS
jgi:hypothetical protein